MTRTASIAALLTSVVFANGCATPRGTTTIGAAAAVIGTGLLIASGTRHSCPSNDPVFCPIGAQLESNGQAELGGLLLVAGVITAIVGITQPAPPAEAPAALAPEPAHRVAHAVTPAETELRSRVQHRLAIQASLTAGAGHCDAAAITARQLAATDRAAYDALLANDADVARCMHE